MARDYYHNHVKEALEKDGWEITDDPYDMRVDGVHYEIDLGAEAMLGASKNGEKIAIEIKSFVGSSNLSEFHRAVGQFNDYFVALSRFEPDRTLFLAVPDEIYFNFFQKQVIQDSLKRIDAKLIVYDPQSRSIVQWIN
ncbi:MAG: element excision factor XisH family protein [Bacteroidota bacterium]